MTSTSSVKTALNVGLDQLSKGVDKILARLPTDQRPTKLTLLNDLAAAIRPGCNWGALKDPQGVTAPKAQASSSAVIPWPPTSSINTVARLTPIDGHEDGLTLAELTENLRPLFSMFHDGEPIVGLDLRLSDGNGFITSSHFSSLILLKDGKTRSIPVYAGHLKPEAAALVFGAIQDVELDALYPILTQGGSYGLRILLGPCQSVGAFPELHKPEGGVEQLGLRILFDEGEPPSIADIEVLLRLASAALPHLALKQFPTNQPIRFRVKQPLADIWCATDFQIPDGIDDRPIFRLRNEEGWTRQSSAIYAARLDGYSKLGEALDLALALVGIDDPEIFLRASVTSAPKHGQRSPLPRGWRGGLHKDWQILRIKPGKPPECLALDTATHARLEAGLNGWADREGYSILDRPTRIKAEALIARDRRRATQHLQEVEAIMSGATAVSRKRNQTNASGA